MSRPAGSRKGRCVSFDVVTLIALAGEQCCQELGKAPGKSKSGAKPQQDSLSVQQLGDGRDAHRSHEAPVGHRTPAKQRATLTERRLGLKQYSQPAASSQLKANS